MGSQSAAPSSPGRPRRSETNAAHGRLYGPQTARRQPNPAWKIRRREARGRRRQVEAGEERAAVDRVASPAGTDSLSNPAAHSRFFLSFLVFGCVEEEDVKFLILLPPPPEHLTQLDFRVAPATLGSRATLEIRVVGGGGYRLPSNW